MSEPLSLLFVCGCSGDCSFFQKCLEREGCRLAIAMNAETAARTLVSPRAVSAVLIHDDGVVHGSMMASGLKLRSRYYSCAADFRSLAERRIDRFRLGCVLLHYIHESVRGPRYCGFRSLLSRRKDPAPLWTTQYNCSPVPAGQADVPKLRKQAARNSVDKLPRKHTNFPDAPSTGQQAPKSLARSGATWSGTVKLHASTSPVMPSHGWHGS